MDFRLLMVQVSYKALSDVEIETKVLKHLTLRTLW